MSKAINWLTGRKKDKSSGNKSPSTSTGGKQSETDSDSSRSNELENPYRGRMSRDHYGNYQPHSHEIDRTARGAEYGKWREQGSDFTSKSEGQGSREYRDWRGDGPARSRNNNYNQRGEDGNDIAFDDWRPQMNSDPNLRDHERPHAGRYSFPGRSSQDPRSSPRPGGNYSLDQIDRRHPFQIRSNTMGQVETGKAADRGQSIDADQQQQSGPQAINLVTAKFDSLLLNWPRLKSESVEKSRFEGRLLKLIEVETEVVVVGEEPTKDRWSLGLVDDGLKALGRAVAARGYPKLKKLSINRCRIIFESPFAMFARAVTATNLPNLEEISFQHIAYINTQGFMELARAFKTGGHFSRLTTLVLIDNGMQDEGLMALAKEGFGSGNLSSLKKLHIGSPSTGKAISEEFHLDAAREFSQELRSSGHLPQLEDLRFSGCVHWKGVVCIVEALESRLGGAIRCLDLSDSPLESAGMRVLARALEAPQFSSLLSLKLDVTLEEMPILFEAFRLKNLYALQRITLSKVSLGEKELLILAALLQGKCLPGLVEFSATCYEITVASALALVRAYEKNNGLVAILNIGEWPMEELKAEYEKHRNINMELDELV
ncbi:hypothetical protein R1flu_018788 [Riccia fluitans]|uniref:Uncharacterized protein n=1 Tax=Riccia fluitans TaxID=41844 RepID=A0ABD1ZI88_9MARC